MASRREIARELGVAKSLVDRWTKRGMPAEVEGAKKWREENCRRRAPTDPKSIAKQIASEKSDDSPGARGRRKDFFENKSEATLPGSLPPLPPGDPLEFARERSLRAADKAWVLLEEAMLDSEKKSTLAMLLTVFNKAVEGLLKTETMIREELERRGVIIPLTTAQDMARKGFHVIISRLVALPQNVGPRCNPHDPHHATEILQTESTGIIADAQKAFTL